MENDPPKRGWTRRLKDTFLGGESHEAEEARLLRLLEINKALVSELRPKRLLDLILDAAIELTHAERGFVILQKDQEESVEAARSLDKEDVRSAQLKISHNLARRVMESGEATLADNAVDDASLSRYASITDLKLRSVLCTPLRVGNRVIGCLYLDHRFEKGIFGRGELKLIELFSDQAALAVENTRLHDENRQSREELDRLNQQLQSRVESQAREIEQIREELDHQRRDFRIKYDYSNIIGHSPVIREVFRLMDIVTDTDYPVLIQGESGTGKELVARAIHLNGARAERPFVSENCAAISETLLESELFGYVKGAFTGAHGEKKGLFELADGGTLFLDEIGEMNLKMQGKLLRVLQEGEFRKVGGRETIRVNVRIISATNADLQRMIEEGTFRDDLYYRLKVMTIKVPPLRNRREDIPLLVSHFLERIAETEHTSVLEITKEASRLLSAHHWPGNIRELENEVLRLAALSKDKIEASLVKELIDKSSPSASGGAFELAGRTLDDIEKEAIIQALKQTSGKKVKAAEVLGIPRRTFYNRLKKHGLL